MTVAAPIRTLTDYYADPIVSRRIAEYCGATALAPPTCIYLAAVWDGHEPTLTWDRAPRFPVEAYPQITARGADIARSMWDAKHLLVHLDIDYQHGEPLADPCAHVFYTLEPVYRATVHVLRRFNLPLLAVLTRRGYHFTGQVPLDSDVTDRLAALAFETPAWLPTVPQRRPPWTVNEITVRHARAYAGVGLLMEYLAHRILVRARRRSPIPIVLNGTVVGHGLSGRDCVSLDISYAGDPLDVRHLRVAFGAFQKRPERPDGDADGPPHPAALVARPRGQASLTYLIASGRSLRHAGRFARTQPGALPTVGDGVERLIDAYVASPLARFHAEFYGTPVCGPAAFESLVQSPRWRSLPECVTLPLLAPNDRLLQPAVIQHLTRVLMADGHSPREIAGIVESRYALDSNWGARWFWLDRRTRAEFDVRVFAGLVAAGLDRGVDFNCRSAQEKALCPGHPCVQDLRVNRQQLIDGPL